MSHRQQWLKCENVRATTAIVIPPFVLMLRIREHQTSLSMIRLSQTASLVTDAQSFYFTSFCVNKIYTRGKFSVTTGEYEMCFYFVTNGH